MTLTKRELKKWSESMWIWLTQEQERIILEHYGDEPFPYEWSEQDIAKGIRRIAHQYPRPTKPGPDFTQNFGQNLNG